MNQIQALIEKARRYLKSAMLLIQDGDVEHLAEWLKSDLSDD